jgi:hydroxymethylbilane synthase
MSRPPTRHLVLGTRGSALALRQAHHVRDALRARHPGLEVEIRVIRTRGDDAGKPLPQAGVGFFTREIERAILAHKVDLGVHSLKDMPTDDVPGLVIAAVPPREDPADALIAREAASLEDLPDGASVLTGSPRRRAQLLRRRPDLNVLPVRGNVDTRIARLDAGAGDALVLALAGLRRLGRADRATQRLDPREFVPACGQGALGIQTRTAPDPAFALCAALDDPLARAAVTAERAFLAALGGGCRHPIAAFAEADGEQLRLTGFVADPDGRRAIIRTRTGEAGPAALGAAIAREMLDAGAGQLLPSAPGDPA